VVRRKTALLAAFLVAVLLLLLHGSLSTGFYTSYGLTNFVNSATALALAAAGETVVVMAGGFDLSVGPMLALVNVVLATQMGTSSTSQWLLTLTAVVVGCLGGAVNGLLVTAAKLPSVIATLGTSFIWSGLAVLILASPGGSVPLDFAMRFTGTQAGIPNALLLIIAVALGWLVLSKTSLRVRILAIGGDPVAAQASRVPIAWTTIQAYALAGVFYGLAGLFLTAQTGSGDPTLGGALTLNAFTAVVVGGTQFGGGRGSPIGGIVGAFILVLIEDVLFHFGISSFYTYTVSGLVLVGAVLLQSTGTVFGYLRPRLRRVNAGAHG
jgi:ribose transport system permease protein